jgi:hypothetical protein
MGVYIVNELISDNNISLLPATAYNYTNKFIGYVLDTSISMDDNSWFRNYMLKSDTFSAVDLSNSQTSEYYLYVLIDENIQTIDDMSLLFDALNKDYNHIVFDANAKENQIISINGAINGSEHAYAYDWSLNPITQTIKLGSLLNNLLDLSFNYTYLINQNIYGQTHFLDELIDASNCLHYLDDKYIDNSNNRIPPQYIDALMGLSASHIVINRKKANRTLPNYEYQTRLACATIVERPTVYVDDTVDTKLFITGEYDYFYKNYMADKTVMHYNAVQTKTTTEYLNKHQIIDQNTYSANFKSNNYKELDCHNGYIDSFYQKSFEYAEGISYVNSDHITLSETKPTRKFDIGDDIIFIDSYKKNISYSQGPSYNNITTELSQLTNNFTNGIESYNIKVLLGSLLPKIYLENNRFINSSWNDMMINTCILDYDYHKNNLEKFHLSQCLAKSRGYDLDIIGYRSNTYKQSSSLDEYQYNIVNVNSYMDNSGYYGSYLFIDPIISYNTDNIRNPLVTIDLTDPDLYSRLPDCLIVTYPSLQTNAGKDQLNPLLQSELAIITDISYINTSNMLISLENRLQNTYEFNNKIEPYNTPNISIPYRSYSTITTSELNNINNTCISQKFHIENKNIITFKLRNDISSGSYMYKNNVTFNNTVDTIIDYGNTQNINYDIFASTPYIIDNSNGIPRNSSYFTRINTSYDNNIYNPWIYDHKINFFSNNILNITNPNPHTLYIADFYGAWKSIYNGTTGNYEYQKYSDIEGINKTYYDSSNNQYFKCYGYYNNNSFIDTNNFNNITLPTLYKAYRYIAGVLFTIYLCIRHIIKILFVIPGVIITPILFLIWNTICQVIINLLVYFN